MTSVNYTIDDSQWATPPLRLSPGWNMIRTNGSDQYINKPQVDVMTPLLDNFWNNSVSWTTDAGASTTLVFEGTDIWAYGMAGPNQGPYIVAMDNETVGQFTAFANETDYHHLLYAAHDLDPSKSHSLTLTNGQNGSSLAFDVGIVTSPSTSTDSPPSKDTTAPSPSDSIDKAAAASAAAAALQPPSMEEIIMMEEKKLAMEWDPHQLAQLAVPYKFHWSASAYFVVVASAIVGLLTIILVVMFLIRALNTRRRRLRTEKKGTSYLVHRKPRPTTRIIDALKRGKISNPMPSEDGGSEYSGKKAGSDRGVHEEAAQGW